jgi:hypothetical protein
MLWWLIGCSGAGFGIGFEVASSGLAGLVVFWIFWFSSGVPVCGAGLFWCRIFSFVKN